MIYFGDDKICIIESMVVAHSKSDRHLELTSLFLPPGRRITQTQDLSQTQDLCLTSPELSKFGLQP